jgi:hypothetical protein
MSGASAPSNAHWRRRFWIAFVAPGFAVRQVPAHESHNTAHRDDILAAHRYVHKVADES